MDWRPFAGCFVQNTYEDFCKKCDFATLEQLKAKAQAPLFTYQPSAQDVEQQSQRFQQLQLHVLQQRRRIKKYDFLQLQTRRERLEQLTKSKVRRQSTDAPRPQRPATTVKAVEKTMVFALTEPGVKMRGSLPPVRTSRREDD